MKAALTILVVAMLLCIVLSAEASDVLQCTGVKLSDGQFFFSISNEAKESTHDCEAQLLADKKVAGISDAEGNITFILPIVNMTVKTAILQTCPEKLEYLLICPSANINEKQQCSCDASPTTLPEVDSPNRSVHIWIGVSVFVLLVIVIVIFVVYRKRQRSGYALRPAEVIV